MLGAGLLTLVLLTSPEPAVVNEPLTGATISLRVGHQFSTDDAHARLQQLMEYWGGRFGISYEWLGHRLWVSGTVVGVSFRAHLDIIDRAVFAESTDPGMLWRNLAREYVGKKLRKYLSLDYAEQ
jgi:hypothetical protein